MYAGIVETPIPQLRLDATQDGSLRDDCRGFVHYRLVSLPIVG